MSDTMFLDGDEPSPRVYTAVINPACVCSWEKASDGQGWDMVRRVAHCVIHSRPGVDWPDLGGASDR